jgi:nitrogen regulatory protein PII
MLQSVKKIEIIVSDVEVPAVLKILKKCQIKNYTIINNISGTGSHGNSSDGLLTNSYIMIISNELEMFEKLLKDIEPLLKKLGGIFIVSDAQWIAH